MFIVFCVHNVENTRVIRTRKEADVEWERENDIEWEYDGEGGGTEGTVNMSQCARATRISGVDNSTFRRNRIGNTVVRNRGKCVYVISNELGIGLFFKLNRVFCTTRTGFGGIRFDCCHPNRTWRTFIGRVSTKTDFQSKTYPSPTRPESRVSRTCITRRRVQRPPVRPPKTMRLRRLRAYDTRIVVLDIYFLLSLFRGYATAVCVCACVR